jgi:NADPH:quinone reductase-like Zn-dependent oxidoreductase
MKRTRGVILSNSSTAGNGDARGWRMALVPDALLNPPHSPVIPGLDVLGAIDANGYGVLQLPPPGKHGIRITVMRSSPSEYAGMWAASTGVA